MVYPLLPMLHLPALFSAKAQTGFIFSFLIRKKLWTFYFYLAVKLPKVLSEINLPNSFFFYKSDICTGILKSQRKTGDKADKWSQWASYLAGQKLRVRQYREAISTWSRGVQGADCEWWLQEYQERGGGLGGMCMYWVSVGTLVCLSVCMCASVSRADHLEEPSYKCV